MDDELGDETCIDVLLVSSALSPPKFTLIGNDFFFNEFSVDTLVFLSFRRDLARSSREKKLIFFQMHFFLLCSFVLPIFKS